MMAVADGLSQQTKKLRENAAGNGSQPKRQELLEIEGVGESVVSLGQGMLDLAALKAGKLDLTPETLAIHESVHGSLRELSIQAHEKGILLVVEVQPSLPQVAANKDGLQMVIEKLVLNAVNFTPPGGVITVRARYEDGWGYISVTDTGIGIKSADRQMVFEPFYRLDGPAGRLSTGAGLGLTMVRELMRQMHGRVDLQSKPNKGSTFTVALPLADTRFKVAPQ